MVRPVFGEDRRCDRCRGTGVYRKAFCPFCGGSGVAYASRAEGLAAGRAARDAAIEVVETHADQTWLRSAMAAVRTIALNRAEFTTDPVWAWLERMGIPEPREPRAMGPVMLASRRDGVCVQTGQYVRTSRPIAHAAPIAVWRSRIYRPES